MLENQAFGWLKTAITRGGGSENHTAIESSTDIHQLISCVTCDFETIKTAAASVVAEGSGETPSTISAADPTEETSSGVGGGETKESASIEVHRQDITTRLDRIKTLLYEERSSSTAAYTSRGSTPNYNWIPSVATATFKSVTSSNLICDMITNLEILPFEARKSLAAIFNYLCVCGMDGVDSQQFTSVSQAFGGYVFQRAHLILGALVKGHECKSVDVILLCGAMLRSCLRHVTLYQWILADPQCVTLMYPFLERCVHDPNFDVSSDALETVRVMLTGSTSQHDGSGGADATSEEEQYKQTLDGIASEFLTRKYDDVVDQRINQCLTPQSNYMTRRMTLQLLSTILLNRSNYNVMIRYISSSSNLVTILNLLRDPSPHITLDAFQVFKIFVANPSKPPEVVKILYDNKVKLVKYLEGLHKEREKSDEQFRDEKGLVIGTLEDLELVER